MSQDLETGDRDRDRMDEKNRDGHAAGPRETDSPAYDSVREPLDDTSGVEEFIAGAMAETSLWPILLVGIASMGALGAAILVLASVDHNPFAIAALVLILGMSADVLNQARTKPSYRILAKGIGLIWCAATAFAGLAVWTGIVA